MVILERPHQSKVLCDYGYRLLFITSDLREILGISALLRRPQITYTF